MDVRLKCLRWTEKTLELLGLEPRTKEMVNYLIDLCLMAKDFELARPQLLCVGCIFFVCKLENDFNPNLEDFTEYLFEGLGFTEKDIIDVEVEILSTMPAEFAAIPTLSEVLLDTCQNLFGQTPPAQLRSHVLELLCQEYARTMPTRALFYQTLTAFPVAGSVSAVAVPSVQLNLQGAQQQVPSKYFLAENHYSSFLAMTK